MSSGVFNELSAAYEMSIDWDKRLANETPFFRSVFAEAGAKRVLDAACGVGRHAQMFHSWGMEVEGADLSETMISRAREIQPEGPGLRWVVRPYDHDAGEARFDACICIGQSLALAPDMQTAKAAIRAMLRSVRAGGVVIVQVLNLWRFAEGPVTWQRCVKAALPQGESLVLKGVHRCGNRGYVDVVIVPLAGEKLEPASRGSPFLGFETAELADWARACGASETEFFGNYQRGAYVRESSVDLILIARKT